MVCQSQGRVIYGEFSNNELRSREVSPPVFEWVMIIAGCCESCGKEAEPPQSAKTLDQSYANDERARLFLCIECFDKRYKIKSKKRSGYGGTIYELEEKQPPRFGTGSKTFSCLRCNWVAWTEAGLHCHTRQKHSA